jgi:YD repeat-containing protein
VSTLSFASIGGVQRPIGSSSATGTTTGTTWSASGNVLTDRSASGNETAYSYDEAGRPARAVVRGASATAVTSVRYADATGLRPAMIASPGRMRAFVYDNLGNATGISELTTNDTTGESAFDAKASGQQRSWGLSYDSANNLNRVQVFVDGQLAEDWRGTYGAEGETRSWDESKSGRIWMVSVRDAAHRPIQLAGNGFDVSVGYDARGRVSTFWLAEQGRPLNGNVQRLLKVNYGYAPDGRVVSRTGTVATNGGADTPVGSDEIDQWLGNYESGVTPVGPPPNLMGWVRALQFMQEAGLEPVCVECVLPPVRWAADAVSWGSTLFGKGGSGCKATQTTIDELQAAANETYATGQLMSKAGRAVTKHPDYFGFKSAQDLRQVYRTNEQLNNFASGQVKNILENGVRTEGEGGPANQGWVTYT